MFLRLQKNFWKQMGSQTMDLYLLPLFDGKNNAKCYASKQASKACCVCKCAWFQYKNDLHCAHFQCGMPSPLGTRGGITKRIS